MLRNLLSLNMWVILLMELSLTGCCRCEQSQRRAAEALEQSLSAKPVESFGITLVGRVTLEDAVTKIAPDQVRVRICPPAPHMPPDGNFERDTAWAQYSANLKTDEGKRRTQRVGVAQDGSFQIPNVPTGSYFLQVFIPGELRTDGVRDSLAIGHRSDINVGLYGDQINLGQIKLLPQVTQN